ncbi:GNAT family N-acetyltransferase [Sphingomonas sp. BK345]|uniref:GNAT family N-acetyltransferase n=1 Tax=Sphingomonas sp. BK345 TaxID=2586980 RepID=UPI00160E8226|nr:GNAT family N-acetyltransferase [Sphingomonas sp. BK345]MBB3473573.1 GNAT superfamily N-acetyltransferase [Sphingomonas sp. BK345]
MKIEIVPATEATMDAVEAWLDAEDVSYQRAEQDWERNGFDGERPVRGFRCNWDGTRRRWVDGTTTVDVLMVDGEPVGFVDGKDILEVRPDPRRHGYGRRLAHFMIERFRDEDRSVLEIEIAPRSAEPFWRRMGFSVVPDRTGPGGGIYAYLVFDRAYELSSGADVDFSIEFFTEDQRYEDEPAPFATMSGTGERLPDGSVQLPRRAICFDPTHEGHHDYFVRIRVDGQEILFDKGKYAESRALGVVFDAGYTDFVDRILTPTSASNGR